MRGYEKICEEMREKRGKDGGREEMNKKAKGATRDEKTEKRSYMKDRWIRGGRRMDL